jgi:hypothetical protein
MNEQEQMNEQKQMKEQMAGQKLGHRVTSVSRLSVDCTWMKTI